MTKWEYRSERINSNFIVDIVSMSNTLGRHGWELVQAFNPSRSVFVVLFKRKVRWRNR